MRVRFLAILFALCACSGESERAGVIGERPADSAAAAAEPTTEVVQVTLREWSLTLVPDTIDDGAVTFQVQNRGSTPHALRVIGAGEEWAIEAIAPGGDATLRVDVSSGLYELFCPLEDERGRHEDLGIRAQIVVQ